MKTSDRVYWVGEIIMGILINNSLNGTYFTDAKFWMTMGQVLAKTVVTYRLTVLMML